MSTTVVTDAKMIGIVIS